MNAEENVRIFLNFGSGDLDASGLLAARSLSIHDSLCNDKYGSSMNTASFKLLNDDAIYGLLRDAEEPASVLILDGDGNAIFRGAIDPVFSDAWRQPDEMGMLSLEAVDLSSRLDVSIPASVSWPPEVGDE
ncbi:MAG: hypothetical protein ACTTJZ_00755, partial [Sphaerochaetaceae bacterium]